MCLILAELHLAALFVCAAKSGGCCIVGEALHFGGIAVMRLARFGGAAHGLIIALNSLSFVFVLGLFAALELIAQDGIAACCGRVTKDVIETIQLLPHVRWFTSHARCGAFALLTALVV